MSVMTKEMTDCLSDLQFLNDEKIMARFSFPRTFVGFDGHFPGNPILPGVCFMHAVVIMLEQTYHKKIKIIEVKVAKFYLPVVHDQELLFECEKKSVKGECYFYAQVHRQDEKIAKMQLKVSME